MLLSDYEELFTDCTTITDANELYRLGFEEYCQDWDTWSEAHRRCMRSLIDRQQREVQIERAPSVIEGTNVSAAKIRNWAYVNGVPVGKRGRLHPALVAQYQVATG